MEFVKQFNAKTKSDKGMIIPGCGYLFKDKSFTFITKSPPASILLLKAAKLQKGSPESNKTKVGKVTRTQCEEIVKIKENDLNADEMDAAVEMIKGTARSMGIVVEG